MTTIAVDQFRRELLVLLEEGFERVYGIFLDKGTSLFETLDTISAEEASQPVSPTCSSIAAQVAHITFYLDTLMKFIATGTNERVDWGEIWRTVEAVTPEEWEASKAALRESYQRLVTMVQTYDNWGAENAVGGAIGMVAHTAYHLGQIHHSLCTVRQR